MAKRVKGNDGDMSLPTLTISAGSGWLDQKDRFSGNIAGSEQKNYTLLKRGQLSYNHGNSKLAKYGAVFVLRTYEKALVPRVYHSFTMLNNADADFIEFLFATKIPDKELVKKITSGARTDGLLNISFEGFMDIAITIPTLPEQQKIGALFRRLDRLITLHKRKWDDVILLKKALLQKMFPKNGERLPEIRFPEFSGDWETHPFKKIAGIRKEHFAQETVSIDIELENLMSDLGEIVGDTSLRTQATSAFKKGDVLFGRLRPYLNKWWLADCDGVKSGEIWALFPLRKVSSLFLYLLVQSKPFLEAANVSSGSKMPRAEWKIIEEVEVMLPSLPEQQKIGTFFRRLDRLISHHQQQYEHYQLLKKALLQQMFI